MQPMVFHPIDATTQGQVQGAENTYGAALGNLQGAQQNVQNYQKNMQSGTDMMAQQTQAGDKFAGYDPQALADAQKAVVNTQSLMANVPKAVNAQNAGYGATAGQLSAQAAGQGQNINQTLGYDVANATQLQSRQQAALGYAQAGTQAGQQGQSMQLQALQSVMTTAQQQYATAQADKQNLETLFQQQGQFNADEAQKYQAANAAMLNAQAAMKAAQGSYANAMAQAQNTNLQSQQMQQAMQYQMTPNANGGMNYTDAGKPITIEQYYGAAGKTPTMAQRMLGQ